MKTVSMWNHLRYFYAHWCNNCFGTMYGTSIVVSCLLLGVSLFIPDFPMEITRLITLLTSCFVFCSIIWQIICLMGTENQSLIPGYSKHILTQCVSVGVIFHSLLVLFALVSGQLALLNKLAIVCLVGSIGLYVCIRSSKLFNPMTMVFTAVVIPLDMLSAPSLAVSLFALVIGLILLYQCYRKVLGLRWCPEALITYQTAMRNGWMPLPDKLFSNQRLFKHKAIFPLFFFTGNVVIHTLLIWLLVLTLLFIVPLISEIPQPILTAFTAQLSGFLGFYIVWTIKQNSHTWPTLILLPIFHNKQHMIGRIGKAKIVYLGFIFASSLLAVLGSGLWLGETTVLTAVNISLYHVLGCALVMLIGYRLTFTGSPGLAVLLVLIVSPFAQIALKDDWHSWLLLSCLLVLCSLVLWAIQRSLPALFRQQ